MITIDGYTDIARIGHGGLGDVYRATRSSTGGTVAIKVLRDVSDESVVWHRTRRELTALVSLAGHSNVIQLLELLELDQGPALVMEYAPGGSVAELMHRRGTTLSVGETVLVGRHTAAALVAAHEQGIVHRDVKPQNLLIDPYGQVKLCDFGVAALTRTDDFRARTNALSMRYASPEDLDDDIDVGPPADVYSLGATLLHLARGAPPTLRERLVPWTPPATDDADAAALDDVIARCLRPDPSARPSAAEVFDELERLGWAVDERQRALAFELPVSDVGDAAAEATDPTDQRVPLDDDSELTAVRPRAPADDDPTVVRGGPSEPDAPHARPMSPAPPRPSATSRPRWLLPAFAGTAVVVVVALAFWWSTRGADDDAATTTVPGATASGSDVIGDVEVELVARPAGLVGVTELVWPFGDVGECLAQTDEVLIPVPCAEPHDLQRILVAELDSARFPSAGAYDAALTRGAVTEACEAAFESYTGVAFAASALETPFTMPSAESWTTGDRRYQCMVFWPGRRIIGDVAASG